MKNLSLYNGRVPIWTNDPDHPIRLVDFPSIEGFGELYKRSSEASIKRYYLVLSARKDGATQAQVARDFEITRERVRQIEAGFLRRMQAREQQPS